MNFVVVTNRRSGSTLLMNLLQSHPQIYARHETMGSAKRMEYPYIKVASMLNKFYSKKEAGEAKATGWKVLYEQMYQPLYQYFMSKDLKIIQLIRKDLLETALWTRTSTPYDARHSNLFEKHGKVEADIPATLNYIQMLKRNIEFWENKAHFTVFYEGDLTNHSENTKTFYNESKRAELLDFLGCNDMELSTTATKKSKLVHSSEEAVSNYKELLKELEKEEIKRYYIADR